MKNIFLIVSLLLCSVAQGQDERYFRKMLTGKHLLNEDSVEKSKYNFKISSNIYQFDINEDFGYERISFQKKDGEDWLYIKNIENRTLFKYRFEAKGTFSRVFKIQIRALSKTSKVFIIYYHEGLVKYINTQGTGRLYFLTIDKNNFSTFSVFKGPYFWDEFESRKGHYHQRKKLISLFDYNLDGTRELTVKYNRMSQVFFYEPGGKWKTFSPLSVR